MLRRIPTKNMEIPRPDQGRFGDCYENGGAERQEKKQEKTKQSHRRSTNIETTKIAEGGGSGQEVSVRYKIAPRRKEKSAFSWFEEFTVAWSETFLSNN